ncbi:MAG: molybdopterin-dependent oxidoreductase [Dehalococcoidales bacterium]
MENKQKNFVVSPDSSKTAEVQEDVWIPAVCTAQCVDECCLMKVHRVNGVAINIEPNHDIENFENLVHGQGRLCPKPYMLLQKVYNPNRIKSPLKRTNPEKGVGVDPKWVEISWDEALDTIAEKLRNIRGSDTIKLAEARGYAIRYDGWAAFLEAFGPTQILFGGRSTHCRQAQHAFGGAIHDAGGCEPDLSYCNYLIIFGANPSAAGGAAQNPLYAEARNRGIKVVVVDPVLSPTAAKADEWLPIKPGTDCAFILAMINIMLYELNVYDAPYLKEMTNSSYLVGPDGYWLRDKSTGKVLVWDSIDQKAKPYDDAGIKDFALEGVFEIKGEKAKPAFQMLKDHVKQYTPEWAAAVTDISVDKIRRITGEYIDAAKIGSTIDIDGVRLPYRPAATLVGRGVTGQVHSYQTVLADHILAVLIGGLEVPGGHMGGNTFFGGTRKDGILFKLSCGSPGVEAGEDGMRDTHHRVFQWPPISYSGWEMLIPFMDDYPFPQPPFVNPAESIYSMDHLDWRNLVDPPRGLPVPPLPEVWLRHNCNPILALGEPKYVIEVLKRIPYTVSISYTLDEVTDFADIILPDKVELESYIPYFGIRPACQRKYFMLALHRPIVDAPLNAMNINDILIELADRAGFLGEFNEQMNKIIGYNTNDTDRLEPGKKYSWEEVVDRKVRFYTNGTYNLEQFKKNPVFVRPVSVEEQYDVYFGMKAKKLRYQIPYIEIVKKTGDQLKGNLAKQGIDWWPTDEYTALPTYFSPVLDEVPSEYDFYVVNCRVAPVSWGSNVGLPWVNEISSQLKGVGNVLMNARTAKKKGIADGDMIWIESPAGKVKQKVKLVQGIRPDCLLISGQFGQYAMPVAKETRRATVSTLVSINNDWTDKMTGNQQSIAVKAKIYKEN